MAGFESQDFDPAVWMEPVAFTSYACMLACCHIVTAVVSACYVSSLQLARH
jgi:hypothetical protein